MELLLLSNSTNHGARRFEHALDELAALYGDREVLFVPYALADHDAYTAQVSEAFGRADLRVRGLHTAPDPIAAVRSAEAVFTGGGNSFRLLRKLQRSELLEPLREVVRSGVPYGGASAGTNMACPTLRTTNDMPIVQPESFTALELVRFQINPHYQDPDPSSQHMGETREQRLAEFLEDNDVPVLGLREGSWLRVSGPSIRLGGHTARLLLRGAPPREYAIGSDLSPLSTMQPHFDHPDR